MKVGLCVPTYNAAKELKVFLPALERAKSAFHQILAIDSSSIDGTAEELRQHKVNLHIIPSIEFDHGGTRQLGVEMLSDCDIIVFLTQDAVLTSPESISSLIKAFENPTIAIAYGRQLPRPGAGKIEAHARLFNYPETSQIKKWSDRTAMGIMVGAVSNSFAAYRVAALDDIGGFSKTLVCSEDVHAGFRALLKGWNIAYVSDATVYHSHNYTLWQEFRRYFDIGAFYGEYESWILRSVGQAESRGIKFILSQMKYLGYMLPLTFPYILLSAFTKYMGFKFGANCRKIPSQIRVKLGMNKAFWLRVNAKEV